MGYNAVHHVEYHVGHYLVHRVVFRVGCRMVSHAQYHVVHPVVSLLGIPSLRADAHRIGIFIVTYARNCGVPRAPVDAHGSCHGGPWSPAESHVEHRGISR